MKRIINWLFASPEEPVTSWEVVKWWERRRIPFNIIVGTYGVVCLMIFMVAITTSGQLKLGEDAVEPMALAAAPFVINILYTLGWIVEVPARCLERGLSPRFGPALLKVGLAFGLFLITLPAAYWGGFRLLQLVGVAHT